MTPWWDINGGFHERDFDEVLLPGRPRMPQEPLGPPPEGPVSPQEPPRAPRTASEAPQGQDRGIIPTILEWQPCDRCGADAMASNRGMGTSPGRLLCSECTAFEFRYGQDVISDEQAHALLAREVRDRLRRSGR